MGSVSKVYFTRTIPPEQVVKMYETLGKEKELPYDRELF